LQDELFELLFHGSRDTDMEPAILSEGAPAPVAPAPAVHPQACG
jgi:hypothetical protein